MSICSSSTALLVADIYGADIKTPILAAPMAFASTPELSAAVTAAGGFGFFGAGKHLRMLYVQDDDTDD